MKLEDLLQALPSKEEIAGVIGLEARSSTSMASAFGIFGTGIILGAGLALLLAPKSGHQIRQDLAEKVSDMSDQLRTAASHAIATASAPKV